MPTELYGKKFESWISFVPNPFPVILFILLFFRVVGQDYYNAHNQDNRHLIWNCRQLLPVEFSHQNIIKIQNTMNLAKKHWFLVAMITSIFTAYFFPWIGASQGPLKPEWSVKVFAVCLIFFLSGLTIKVAELHSCLFQWRLHFFVQTWSLMLTPILVLLMVLCLPIFNHDTDLGKG